MKFPIILESPDGRCFRRIHAPEKGQHRIEKKMLGMEWEPSPDILGSPFISTAALGHYLETMTNKLHWKSNP